MIPTTEMPAAAASLYESIMREPDNDLYRLAFADEIEATEPALAEFIRVQIELAKQRAGVYAASETNDRVQDELSRRETDLWLQVRDSYESDGMQLVILNGRMRDQHRTTHAVVFRGFIDSVTLSMKIFMGGPCERCEESGTTFYTDAAGDMDYDTCEECHGKRTVPGLIDRIGKIWPVTSVTLTGVETYITGAFGRGRHAFDDDVPKELKRLMPDTPDNEHTDHHFPTFPTRPAALLALDHAATDLMRERAGLPSLRRK